MTVEEIIQDAVSDGLGLPRDPIANDVIQEAVARYRKVGRALYDDEIWDNKKIDGFTSDDSTYVASFDTSTGIITFVSTVDMVRAVVAVDSSSLEDDTFIWPENDVAAYMRGDTIGNTRFQILADDSSNRKRIKINVDDDVTQYRILATLRFVPATIESSYDSSNPSNTPTDYRVLTWPIRDADPVIVAYMADELRAWDGQAIKGDWGRLLNNVKDKLRTQEARENVFMPIGDFREVGNWDARTPTRTGW